MSNNNHQAYKLRDRWGNPSFWADLYCTLNALDSFGSNRVYWIHRHRCDFFLLSPISLFFLLYFQECVIMVRGLWGRPSTDDWLCYFVRLSFEIDVFFVLLESLSIHFTFVHRCVVCTTCVCVTKHSTIKLFQQNTLMFIRSIIGPAQYDIYIFLMSSCCCCCWCDCCCSRQCDGNFWLAHY